MLHYRKQGKDRPQVQQKKTASAVLQVHLLHLVIQESHRHWFFQYALPEPELQHQEDSLLCSFQNHGACRSQWNEAVQLHSLLSRWEKEDLAFEE